MKTFFGKETPPLHKGIKSAFSVGWAGLHGCRDDLLLVLAQKLAKNRVSLYGVGVRRSFLRLVPDVVFNRGGSIKHSDLTQHKGLEI